MTPTTLALSLLRRLATAVLLVLLLHHGLLSVSANDNDDEQKECAVTNQGNDESCDASAAADDDSPYETLELPKEWDDDNWGFHDCWWHLDCNSIVLADGRSIPSQDDWNILRNVYRTTVGMDKSTILPMNEKNGWYIPIEVKLSPGAGRGVFAKADVRKGTRVWTSRNHQQARFDNAQTYRNYLKAVPVELVCDVLQWTYIKEDWTSSGTTTTTGDDDKSHEQEPKKKYNIFAELDEGALCNTGEDDENNVGCLPEFEGVYHGGCKQNLFALRDIKEGEEILVSYANWGITEPQQWNLVGL